MHTRNCQNFKGEIEFYLKNGQNVYDSKIDSAFKSLKFKTWLCRANSKYPDPEGQALVCPWKGFSLPCPLRGQGSCPTIHVTC